MSESEPKAGGGKEGKENLNKKVLVADDSLGIRSYCKSILKAMGCTVVTVNDGQELVDKLFSGEAFDLLLTDNTMPRLTGLEALKQIRANEKFRDLPVIIHTGDEHAKNDIEKEGGIYLEKSPGRVEEFEKAVRDALKKKVA